jgi:hypothetical protein
LAAVGKRGPRKLRAPDQKLPDLSTLSGLMADSMRHVRLASGKIQREVEHPAQWSAGKLPLLECGQHSITLRTVETWVKAMGVMLTVTIRYTDATGREKFRAFSVGKVQKDD